MYLCLPTQHLSEHASKEPVRKHQNKSTKISDVSSYLLTLLEIIAVFLLLHSVLEKAALGGSRNRSVVTKDNEVSPQGNPSETQNPPDKGLVSVQNAVTILYVVTSHLQS